MNLEFLITRTIFETPAISQRALAKKYFVSLGKINSVINKIIDDGLIKKSEKEGFYSVTEAGEASLTKHKVDGAIILACGRGVEINQKYEENPICFLEIKNERLIERQIKQLNAAGINDITIMVGFMKEKFDYLIDKYNVRLIYNDEYEYKNTLSTFYHAREIMKNKNMYICVSDVYIENNPYHLYEVEPYYTGIFYEDCKNEWRYIVNSKNEIKKVEVGGVNDFCLVGSCFLTSKFIGELMPLVEDYYNKSFTDNYYWEDVLVQNLDKLPKIYLYKMEKDELYEFDTQKDIENFKKYDKEFQKQLIAYIADSLNADVNNVKNLERIKENSINIIYKFNVDNTEYVIRVPKENTNILIDRKTEIEVIDKIAKSNKFSSLTEEVVDFNTANGYKISKLIKNFHPVNTKNKNELKKCMELYKVFHTSGIKVAVSCDIIDMIKKCLDIIRKNNIIIPYEDFNQVLEKAKKIKEFIENENRPITICHGDANPNNVLVTDNGLKLIEFEYSGMADPISDIALFGIYVKFDIEKTYELYKMYKESPVSDNIFNFFPEDEALARKLIISYMALGGLYNALWAIARGVLSNADYGTFGMDGYRTFKNCYSYF